MSTILIVDDDKMILRTVEYTLRGAGHKVIATSQPAVAAELAEQRRVDAVVLDVIMPGRSGYEVLADMRRNPKTARIPVLMLSSLAESSDRVKGLRRGASEYVTKPFDPEELILRLNRILAGRDLDDVEFQGRLESISYAEIAQGFLQGDRSGVLEVVSGNLRGELAIEGGRATAASFSRLVGVQAVLVMLGLTKGTFRFVNRIRDFEDCDTLLAISIQQAIFAHVWLEDELNSRGEVNEDAFLWPTSHDQAPPAVLTAGEVLPLYAVWQFIMSHPGTPLKAILQRELGAPRAVHLAVWILIENGHILCTSTLPCGLPTHVEDISGLEAVVTRVTKVARIRGFEAEQTDMLLVVEPSTQATLLELRRNIDARAIAGSCDSLIAAWRRGDPALLPLRGADGELVVHIFSVESKSACHKIKARLADFACVVILAANSAAMKDLSWIVEWLANAPNGHWGLFLSTTSRGSLEIAAMLEASDRWIHHGGVPSTFDDLLDLVATAGAG